LRREIIATVVCNEIVTRAGATFVYEAAEKSGMKAGDVAKAYVVAREIFEMPGLWQAVEDLDNVVQSSVQATLLLEIGRAITAFSVWLLRIHGSDLDIGAQRQRYASELRRLVSDLPTCLAPAEKAWLSDQTVAYIGLGVPEPLARNVASLSLLAPVGDIVTVAHEFGLSVEHVARTYFAVGDRFGLAWLRQQTSRLPTARAWDKQAASALLDDLYACQRKLVVAVAREPRVDDDPAQSIERWATARAPQLEQITRLLSELRAGQAIDLAMLVVANRQLEALI
jgi:glutamate dehydrogenase